MNRSSIPSLPPSLIGLLPILDQYERAWQGAIVPDLAAFHAQAVSSMEEGAPRHCLLPELIKIDLEYRWRPEAIAKLQASDPSATILPARPVLEQYFTRHPELDQCERTKIDLILEEFRVRWRWGDKPTPDVYCERFGQLADRLNECFREINEEFAREKGSPPESTQNWDTTIEAMAFPLPDPGVPLKNGSAPSHHDGDSDWPKLPAYEITAQLGQGGMGVVYQARHLTLKRTVAIKMIREGRNTDPELRLRFLAEARAVASLDHPNIVRIHEIGEQTRQPFVSLEYIDGGNLSNYARNRLLSDMEAARIVEILARAVHYAHGRGVIHRDLKPANILLTSDGTPKVSDFGLAKILHEDSTATQSGAVVGSPSYMAPEQAAGQSARVTGSADIYALGAILYELLTGRPPFRGTTFIETLQQVCEKPPHPPREFNPRIDRALEAICLKCLKKSPKDRYPSAAALADDLSAFLRGEAVRAQSGTTARLLDAVFRESRYTEIMHLWSGIWIGLAGNAFASNLAFCLLIWNDVHDYLPYYLVWIAKGSLDLFLAWFLRIRNGPPVLPVERQLVQILTFFWAGHFLFAWLFIRSGGDVFDFLPFINLEVALVLSTMAAILGGSFYVTAGLCTLMAIFDALWLGVGQVFGMMVVVPTFFWLGWNRRRRLLTE